MSSILYLHSRAEVYSQKGHTSVVDGQQHPENSHLPFSTSQFPPVVFDSHMEQVMYQQLIHWEGLLVFNKFIHVMKNVLPVTHKHSINILLKYVWDKAFSPFLTWTCLQTSSVLLSEVVGLTVCRRNLSFETRTHHC